MSASCCKILGCRHPGIRYCEKTGDLHEFQADVLSRRTAANRFGAHLRNRRARLSIGNVISMRAAERVVPALEGEPLGLPISFARQTSSLIELDSRKLRLPADMAVVTLFVARLFCHVTVPAIGSLTVAVTADFETTGSRVRLVDFKSNPARFKIRGLLRLLA